MFLAGETQCVEDPETFSASTRAVIGQFTVHILLYSPLKFKVVLLPNYFVINRQVFLTFIVTVKNFFLL